MGLLHRIQLIGLEVERVLVELGTAEAALDRIGQKMENIIMAEKTITELLGEMDTATTGVANRIQGLLDQISAPDASAADLAAAKVGIQAEIDKLSAMGTGGVVDPNNPNP